LPGSLPNDTRLLDDLADVVDSTRNRMPQGMPLILLGHSMGGLVVGRFVSLRMRTVEALIMSSPALDPGLSAFQKLLVSVLPGIAPNLRVGNGVKPQFISHNPAVVKAYREDPLVHDRISARLASFIAAAGPATVALASQWQVPTLLMYAGDDHLLNADGSRAFAAAAPQNMVTTVCFDALYHEIFNELDATAVFASLQHWLDQRF
jgi:alpha-beta hydrolase superfamily lysophospholipase